MSILISLLHICIILGTARLVGLTGCVWISCRPIGRRMSIAFLLIAARLLSLDVLLEPGRHLENIQLV